MKDEILVFLFNISQKKIQECDHDNINDGGPSIWTMHFKCFITYYNYVIYLNMIIKS